MMGSTLNQHTPSPAPLESAEIAKARLLAMLETGLSGTSGRLPTERDLSAAMQVSRRSVRRALQQLEADGLIWRKQGKGTFAGLPPDPTQTLAAEIVGETNFLEVMEARLCIEPALAAMCATKATPADIDRMHNLARRIVEATDPQSIELWDGSLHRLIARTAGNRPLLTAFSMVDEIRNSQNWRGLRHKARSLETLRVSDNEHRAIIDAIEAGNPILAEAAMRAHLQTLAANLRRIMPAAPSEPES
jgi:DNA-binding FadR family transcriptional regulator